MKTRFAAAFLLVSASLAGAQNKMTEELRNGIVEEDANHDLDKAIQSYQSILSQFDEERKTAATALFRLAECYRKQGKREQAISAYNRVLREFGDQSKLADQSRSQLSKTYGISQSEPAAAAERTPKDKSFAEQELDELRLRLKELQMQYTAKHPEVMGVRARVQELEQIVNARRMYRSLLEDEIRLVEDQIKGEERNVAVGAGNPLDKLTQLKRDLLTLKRALAVVDEGREPLPMPTPRARP